MLESDGKVKLKTVYEYVYIYVCAEMQKMFGLLKFPLNTIFSVENLSLIHISIEWNILFVHYKFKKMLYLPSYSTLLCRHMFCYLLVVVVVHSVKRIKSCKISR